MRTEWHPRPHRCLVVICARAKDRCPIVTSDPDDMMMLDPTLPITKI